MNYFLFYLVKMSSVKMASVEHDALRHCARWPDGPDSDAFSIWAPTQMD
jgi:hypothetical protein